MILAKKEYNFLQNIIEYHIKTINISIGLEKMSTKDRVTGVSSVHHLSAATGSK